MVRFLIVRLSSIGDIILTTPVIRHLKEQVDGAEVHYLVKEAYAPMLESNPFVDRVHIFAGDMKETLRQLKAEDIDYVIDLHRNIRSARIKYGLKRIDFSVRKLNIQKWLYVNLKLNRLPDLHMVDRNLETIRAFITEQDGRGLDYFIPEDQEVSIEGLPQGYRDGYIGLAIGAQHETKKLPVTDLVHLCGMLNDPVVILGGPRDRETGDQIISGNPGKTIFNACGSYTIHQSASLVRQSRVLITHDTGLMHMGAAFGKMVISVWGNTVPEFGMYPYKPDPRSVRFEVDGLGCRPCSKIGHQRCPEKHFRCMADQDLEGIARTAEALFRER